MNRGKQTVLLIVLMLATFVSTPDQLFATVSCKPSARPFARGYCSIVRGRHGQWVRGTATLTTDGNLGMKLGLETDSGFLGIAGWVEVTLLDKAGRSLGTYKSATCAAVSGHSKPATNGRN